MGLFKTKGQRMVEKVIKENGISSNKKMFTCRCCGRRQLITYFGKNDSWTCPQCKTKNYCS